MNDMKEAILYIGLPGSGKTTHIEKEIKGKGYVIVSADDLKDANPEKSSLELEDLHQWSVKGAETLMNTLSDMGANICMDSGGVNNSYSVRIINMLKSKGYRIRLIHMNTPVETCLRRNTRRNERKLPEEIILEKAKKLEDCVQRQKELADQYDRIDALEAGQRVALKSGRRWTDWGFDNSTVVSVSENLVKIRGWQGHEITVKHEEIELL